MGGTPVWESAQRPSGSAEGSMNQDCEGDPTQRLPAEGEDPQNVPWMEQLGRQIMGCIATSGNSVIWWLWQW